MGRTSLASLLGYVAAGLLTLTGIFHLTGLSYVRRLAAAAGGELAAIAPLLWVAFSVSLVVAALVAVVGAHRPDRTFWPVPLCLALIPAAAVALQVTVVGFSLPTAALLLDAVALVVAAAALRRLPAPPAA